MREHLPVLSSPYRLSNFHFNSNMISVVEAIRIVKEQARCLPSERVTLSEAVGRVLAEDVVADSDLPPFHRAQMDGYALRAADVVNVPVRLRVVGEAAAGRGWHRELKAGEAVRIMTGAPVPAGADSVQKVEVTQESEVTEALEAGAFVEVREATKRGQFIVERASEVTRGTVVLRAGETINAAMMAALASFGYAEVAVGARPRVCVLATGTELVAVDKQPGADEIRDSNSYSLGAYAGLAGAQVERLPLAGDDLVSLQGEIESAAGRCDVLILSGGVSMGVYDFTKTALRALGAEVLFERVALRPGKPTVFARLQASGHSAASEQSKSTEDGATSKHSTLVFGLPGNPVSVSVTFNLFARVALRVMQGAQDATLKEERALLSHPVKGAAERESFLPATLDTDDEARLRARPLKWGGSSDFVAFTRAGALINVPQGAGVLEAGEIVRVLRLPG
jgi:molybdenum cofactor synthesis domain-containing protein